MSSIPHSQAKMFPASIHHSAFLVAYWGPSSDRTVSHMQTRGTSMKTPFYPENTSRRGQGSEIFLQEKGLEKQIWERASDSSICPLFPVSGF